MDIKEYANQSRLPLNAVMWMFRKNVVSNPLTEGDLFGLKMVEQIWGSSDLLRTQLKRFSKPDRLRLIETCEFETKWEAYAFSRFSNVSVGERVSMRQLISEIEMNYELTIGHPQRKRLYNIRERVYNRRRYRKKIEKSQEH